MRVTSTRFSLWSITSTLLAICAATFLWSTPLAVTQTTPGMPLLERKNFDACIEVELKRLDEVYQLLDTFAERIWPGWNAQDHVEFQVRFPNGAALLMNPQKAIPQGYSLMTRKTKKGHSVYLNELEVVPAALVQPLTGTGQASNATVRIKLRLPDEETKNDNLWTSASDEMILIYVHELFHCYQEPFLSKYSEGDQKAFLEFSATPEFAVYSEIERAALLSAFTESDKGTALEFFKDYFVANRARHRRLPRPVSLAEDFGAFIEGTAMYAQIKMGQWIKETHYRPLISRKDDGFFSGFERVDEINQKYSTVPMERFKSLPLAIGSKHYSYGLFTCLLLDRFFPDWKRNLMARGITQNAAIERYLGLSSSEMNSIGERIRKKYNWDALYAGFAATIKERDDTLALVKVRKGKKYVVNFETLKERPRFVPRMGKRFRVGAGVEAVFPQGIEKVSSGEVELETINAPFFRSSTGTIEWIDIDARPGEKGYELTYDENKGNVFKRAVLKTRGFILKAPEIRLEEGKDGIVITVLKDQNSLFSPGNRFAVWSSDSLYCAVSFKQFQIPGRVCAARATRSAAPGPDRRPWLGGLATALRSMQQQIG